MKKVLLVANAKYVITNFRQELVNELIDRGYEVKMVSPKGVDLNGEVVGDEVLNIRLSRGGINPIKDFQTFVDLVKIFIREKPDFILNFTVKPAIYSSLAAGLFSRAKILSNITGLGYVFIDQSLKVQLLKKLVVLLYKVALFFNAKVFFQNPDDVKLFLELGILPKEKVIQLNGSGINTELFPFFQNYSAKEKNSFLFVGRLLKDKGVGELISAMRIVKKIRPDAQCYIIGERDNNPNSFTQKEVDQWVKEGLVIFLGRQNNVLPYLQNKGVLILPSYREGTPRSVLEAMSVGLPIITTDAPGCRETVLEGKNGFLVPVQDSQILADKILYFLEHPDAVQKMGEESRKYVEAKFDVRSVNKMIISAMES